LILKLFVKNITFRTVNSSTKKLVPPTTFQNHLYSGEVLAPLMFVQEPCYILANITHL